MYERNQHKNDVGKMARQVESSPGQLVRIRDNRESVARRIQTTQPCILNKTLQMVTAKAAVTVSYEAGGTSKTAEGTGVGTSGKENQSNNFAKYFIQNIPSMTIRDIAYEDNWPDDLRNAKRNEMDVIRNSIHCAEPNATIAALENVKPKLGCINEDNIKEVNISISDILNRNQPMRPCAVCRQWLSTTDLGVGSGRLEWLKDPLSGFTMKTPQYRRLHYDYDLRKYISETYK